MEPDWHSSSLQLAGRIKGEAHFDTYLSLQDKERVFGIAPVLHSLAINYKIRAACVAVRISFI